MGMFLFLPARWMIASNWWIGLTIHSSRSRFAARLNSGVRPHTKIIAMLKNLKFPLLHVVTTLLWLPLIAAFYGTISFLAAQPIASLDLQGKSLPANWEAAVPNHGKFLQGYLISNHPVAFSLSVAVLLGGNYLLYLVQRAQLAQAKEAGASGAMAHRIANACVVAVLATLGYFLVMHVLVGVSAA
jgi:hypothetical protein